MLFRSEAQRVPYWINPRRNKTRHILIKLTNIKDKEKILKSTREKQQITYKGSPRRLSADFSAETLQVTRERHDILKVMKGKNLHQEYPESLYSDFTEKSKALQRSKS